MKSSDDRAARGSGGASVGDAEKAAGKTAAEIRAADVTAVSAAPECRPSYAEVIPSADGGLFYGALGAAEEARAAAELLAVNRETAVYGLSLTEKEARSLAAVRTEALADTGRVEFGGSALPKIARSFAPSPYSSRRGWYDELVRLTEIFYRFKSETGDRLVDDELLSIMRRAFDGSCGGSVDLLEGRELDILARRVRSGYTAGTEELDETLPDDDYDEGDGSDGFTAERTLF